MDVPKSTEKLLSEIIKKDPFFKDFKIYLSNQDIKINEKNPLVISIKIDFVKPISSYIKEFKCEGIQKNYYISLTEENCSINIISYDRENIGAYPIKLQHCIREWSLNPSFTDLKFYPLFQNWLNLSSLEGTDRVSRYQIKFHMLREYVIEAQDDEYIDGSELKLKAMNRLDIEDIKIKNKEV